MSLINCRFGKKTTLTHWDVGATKEQSGERERGMGMGAICQMLMSNSKTGCCFNGI